MDIHEVGISAVFWLQENLSCLQSCFLWFSSFGDPRNAFLVIFPICYGLSSRTGIACLWIAALTEWINAILKWSFLDGRPFSWPTNESKFPRKMVQFPMTCETGPGFPSGHVMSTSAVGLHILLALNVYMKRHAKPNNKLIKEITKHGLTALFLATVTLVAVSRVYIATHFPHQVMAAVFIGVLITFIVGKMNDEFDLSGSLLCIVLSAILLIGAYCFHGALVVLGYDPSITIPIAMKACLNSKWIHLDTTPFYAVTRDSAVIFGLGIAVKLLNSFAPHSPDELKGSKILTISVNLIICYFLENLNLPQTYPLLFYMLAFCKFSVIPVFIVCVTPICVSHLKRKFTFNNVNKIK